MKNDLNSFEKKLLRHLNKRYNKKYTYKNLMEWSTSRDCINKNLQLGETVFECLGYYVAVKEVV